MSDLISRQQAIEAFEPTHYMDWYTPTIIDTLETLPSVQPEVLACGNGELVQESDSLVKDLVKDCISRQEAIDAVKDLPNCRNGFSDTYDKACIIGVLEDLPSAQPQRKKGRWIPVDSFSAFGGDEAMWMAHGNPVAFYYCSECKEQAYAGEDGESLLTDFCPQCGARMNGGESDER